MHINFCKVIIQCMFQILLYNGSYVEFSNNAVSQYGAGIYVEYASSDFLLSVLNTGCFIRYYTVAVDIQPTDWVRQKNHFFFNFSSYRHTK